MTKHRGNPGLRGRLLDKSIEAYILALETINRLSIKYRVETFAYLICNAWELLSKARIIGLSGKRSSIYHPKERKQKRRSLALRDCLKQVFPNDRDPIRLNTELIADLRDEAVHLVIRDVPLDVIALFQACVLNYHRKLIEWFDVSLSDRVPVGMMALVYDLGPENFDLRNAVLKRRMGKDAIKYLGEFEARIRREHDTLGKPAEFSVGIEYRVALTKRADDADIVLSAGPGGTEFRVVAVAKDPGTSHPHRQTEAVAAILKELPPGTHFTSFDLQCIVRAHGVKKRPDWFYKGSVVGSPLQYSDSLVAWVVQQVKKDNRFTEFARAKCREMKSAVSNTETLAKPPEAPR